MNNVIENKFKTVDEIGNMYKFNRMFLLNHFNDCKKFINGVLHYDISVIAEYYKKRYKDMFVEFEGKTFKRIPGWNLYFISMDAEVLSWVSGKAKILTTNIQTNGYPFIVLFKNKKAKAKTIHSLMYLTYIGDIPEGKEIDHRDGNKLNNSISNLRAVTRKENMQFSHSRLQMGHKLTAEDVTFIRDSSLTTKALAEKYNVHPFTIRNVIKKKTYKYV